MGIVLFTCAVKIKINVKSWNGHLIVFDNKTE